ncbi:MAG: hypothetical protein ACK5XA_11780, partial [Tagaea sp.]
FAPIARARIAAVEAARALATAEAERNRQAADAARQAAEAARAREVQETARASGEAERAQRVVDEFRASSARQIASVGTAGAVPRVFAPINATLRATAGAGIFGASQVLTFLTIEEGVFRVTASNMQGNMASNNFRCFGSGIVGADRSIDAVEMRCTGHHGSEVNFTFTGRIVENGGRFEAQTVVETARGRKHELLFR